MFDAMILIGGIVAFGLLALSPILIPLIAITEWFIKRK